MLLDHFIRVLSNFATIFLYSVIVALTGLPIGYSVIVVLTGLPIGYSVIVALTGLPIGYSVIVALTGLPIGYSVIVVLTGLPIGYSVIVALTGLPIGYSVIVALTGLPIGYSVIVALTGLPIGYSVIVALTGLPIGYSVIVALTGLPIGYSVIVATPTCTYNSDGYLRPFQFTPYSFTSWLNMAGIQQILDSILMTTINLLLNKLSCHNNSSCEPNILYLLAKQLTPHTKHETFALRCLQRTSHIHQQIMCHLFRHNQYNY